jgi:ketosteroid isomerase-like protein
MEQSMTQPNVVLVTEILARFVASGEISWELLDRDIEVRDHDVIDAGAYRGHAGFARWLENWGAAWADYSVEVEELIDRGDRVVSVIRMNATGRGSGVAVERQDAMVWKLDNGKAIRLDYYNNRTQALNAAEPADK